MSCDNRNLKLPFLATRCQLGGTSARRSRVDLPNLATRCHYGGVHLPADSRVDLPNLSSLAVLCFASQKVFSYYIRKT